MLYQAHSLPEHTNWKAYRGEESKFFRTIREVSTDKVAKNANAIPCHVIYEVKVNDDSSLKGKPE